MSRPLLLFLILSLLPAVLEGFLFGSGGCSCGPPPCPPPPVCQQPLPVACPCVAAARRAAARGDKTSYNGPVAKDLVGSAPYSTQRGPVYYPGGHVPVAYDDQPWPPRDPLELQATLNGVNLHGHQKLIAASSHRQELDLLERLGQDDGVEKHGSTQYLGGKGKGLVTGAGAAQFGVTRHPQLLAKRSTTPPTHENERADFEQLVSSLKSEAAAAANSSSSSFASTTPFPQRHQGVVRTVTRPKALGSGKSPTFVPALEDASKCNSQVLKKLMLENISDISSVSKRRVNEAAERKFGGNIDVICSRGHFSYVFTSSLFCEATKGPVTCIAFRQTVQPV